MPANIFAPDSAKASHSAHGRAIRPDGKLARNLPPAGLAIIHDPAEPDVSHLRQLGLRPFKFFCSASAWEEIPGVGPAQRYWHLSVTAWADSEKSAAAHVAGQLRRFCPAVKGWSVLPAA